MLYFIHHVSLKALCSVHIFCPQISSETSSDIISILITWSHPRQNMGISLDNFKSIFTCRTLLGSLALTGTCLACDHILQLPGVASSTYGRAVVDNFSHGMVGAMSWAMVVLVIPPCSLRQLAEVILCGLLASLLDVDHFIAARSFELKVKGLFFCQTAVKSGFTLWKSHVEHNKYYHRMTNPLAFLRYMTRVQPSTSLLDKDPVFRPLLL